VAAADIRVAKEAGESGFAGSTGGVFIRYNEKKNFLKKAGRPVAPGTKKRASYLFIR
jgi:hypothetical protein